MKNKRSIIYLIFVTIILLLPIFLFTFSVTGRQAGVGVLNVNPKFGHLRIEQRTDTIRVYLTISDYNSWGDIYKVTIELMDKEYDELIARFEYKQYESQDKWEKIDIFEQTYGEPLLIEERCSCDFSTKRTTVEERCDMDLLFVFNKTWFTTINVNIRDREGYKDATAEIDYIPISERSEPERSGNLLFVPWFDNPFFFEIPEYLPMLLAILFGILGAMLCVKKRKEIWVLKRNSYDNG